MWSLHQRIAELVTISEPGDLHTAINQAEKIEMARNFAANGQQGQRPGTGRKGRGGFYRGRGKFNAVQGSHINPPVSSSVSQVQTQPLAVQSTSGQMSSGRRNALCYNCNGYGHYAWECPSASRTAQRSGRPMRGRWLTRGRRGGRGRG